MSWEVIFCDIGLSVQKLGWLVTLERGKGNNARVWEVLAAQKEATGVARQWVRSAAPIHLSRCPWLKSLSLDQEGGQRPSAQRLLED